MSNQLLQNGSKNHYSADCENCFGLCCIALPYAKSADFAIDKEGGTPCSNLNSDFRCGVHHNLRKIGFRGCAVYECFGAGQKVSQATFDGKDWREHPAIAKEMFRVFPIIQQLQEILRYLSEALSLEEAKPIFQDLQNALMETEQLTNLSPKAIIELNVPAHRAMINDLLVKTSELVRGKVSFKKNRTPKIEKVLSRGRDLIAAKLRGVDLKGANLRGAILIAADLREADMRSTDLIGADLRDADISGANLTGSIFLTQAQINSAKGDRNTKLPATLSQPDHWS